MQDAGCGMRDAGYGAGGSKIMYIRWHGRGARRRLDGDGLCRIEEVRGYGESFGFRPGGRDITF